MKSRLQARGRRIAFTLIEILVAISILVAIMGIVFAIVTATGKLWQSTSGKIGAFQQGRIAFESMTRKVSQATLNTYLDYNDPAGPTQYIRQSELHFIVGQATVLISSPISWSGQGGAVRTSHAIFFQAPLGYDASGTRPNSDRLLNACGYYVEFNSNEQDQPQFIRNNPAFRPKYRWRLMEISQPSSNLSVYAPDFQASKGWPIYNGWLNQAIAGRQVRPVAENIVALIARPMLSPADPGELAPEYHYDSRNSLGISGGYTAVTPAATRTLHRNQLPPLVQLTMVAIDESSAVKLAAANGNSAPELLAPGSFQNASQYLQDLESLERSLASKGISFRIFSTAVSLRGAKWSNN